VNVGTLVAHGPARAAAIGSRAGPPSPDGQRRLEEEVRGAVEAGAFGVSFGLIYPPGQFADTRELIGAAAAAGAAGGLAAFHQRGSSRATLLPAVREIVEVGRAAGVAVHHSHVETVGPRAWPGTGEVLRLHAEAEESGIDIGGDVIPYTSVCTTFLALFPPWALDGGVGALLERIGDPVTRRRIREEVASADPIWPPWEEPGRWTMNIARECGWNRIRLAHVDGARHATEIGRTVEAIGRRRGRDPFDALCDLLIEERGVATQLISGISGDESTDESLLPLLASPRLAFCTDAWDIGKGFPHPGACGAFPRVLGHYVRERRLIPLEEAVRRMTSLPARRLGLEDRGRIASGCRADLVVLDPATVTDRSTLEDSRRMPAGIDDVFVNGRRLVAAGAYRPVAAGEVLRRAA
jgi:N-acyl-D-aspartate/D-glutamate deacylase